MNNFEVMKGEHEDEFLIRIGKAKENGEINATWQELTNILNKSFRDGEHCDSESCWRKKYKRMTAQDYIDRDNKSSMRRVERGEARVGDFHQRMLEAITAAKPVEHMYIPGDSITDRAIIAMLGDIHFGLQFENRWGKYSPEIAAKRVMDYADYLIDLGMQHNVSTIYVPLMGDLVSGIIHSTIRAENRQNLVDQIVNVSELITSFLLQLSRYFENVYFASVDGNHSRVDMSADSGLRNERLDWLVAWYCKGRTSQIENIAYIEGTDKTIADLEVLGKHYVCVHGDLDPNLKTSCERLSSILGYRIDYLLAGHTHVPEMTLEYTGYVRNGCVCGTGDDYTAKHRFHSPAMQIALVCTADGVESINPYYMK